jgi:hypothetical protein
MMRLRNTGCNCKTVAVGYMRKTARILMHTVQDPEGIDIQPQSWLDSKGREPLCKKNRNRKCEKKRIGIFVGMTMSA